MNYLGFLSGLVAISESLLVVTRLNNTGNQENVINHQQFTKIVPGD